MLQRQTKQQLEAATMITENDNRNPDSSKAGRTPPRLPRD